MMATKKTSSKPDVVDVNEKLVDVVVFGRSDLFQTLYSASSVGGGWIKSVRAMEIAGCGCVVQTTTQQGDHGTDALVFVPGVKVVDDDNGGRKLVSTVAARPV
jgi:hypothetical protein